MENKNKLITELQEYLNQANSMLVEAEGDKLVICLFNYDNCVVSSKEDDDIITFIFYVAGIKTGTFITSFDQIIKYNISDGMDIFKLVYKHELQDNKPLVDSRMFNILHNETPLPKDFNLYYIYNSNRGNNSDDIKLLSSCYDDGLLNIRRFEIDPIKDESEDKWDRMKALGELREYQREKDRIIDTLYNFVCIIRKEGYDVDVKRVFNDGNTNYQVTARAYIPEWNLIIQPATQDINTLLTTLAQNDNNVCIITSEDIFYEDESKIIVYLVERKRKYFIAYSNHIKGLEKRGIEQYSLYT